MAISGFHSFPARNEFISSSVGANSCEIENNFYINNFIDNSTVIQLIKDIKEKPKRMAWLEIYGKILFYSKHNFVFYMTLKMCGPNISNDTRQDLHFFIIHFFGFKFKVPTTTRDL